MGKLCLSIFMWYAVRINIQTGKTKVNGTVWSHWFTSVNFGYFTYLYLGISKTYKTQCRGSYCKLKVGTSGTDIFEKILW
jgi:hypothetical protein